MVRWTGATPRRSASPVNEDGECVDSSASEWECVRRLRQRRIDGGSQAKSTYTISMMSPSRCTRSRQVFTYHSRAAYLQFDEPDLVVKAIREVYDQSRSVGGAAR
jgi:hypothetical protein